MSAFSSSGQTLSGWTIVFDLDGTLVETAPDLLAALNHVLALENCPPVALEDVRTMIGHGAKAMIRQGLTLARSDASEASIEARIDALWPEFIAFYERNIAVESHPFPGLVTLLNDLKAAGATLAVCTNKTQRLSDQLLDALELSSLFSAIVGADSVPSKKPDGDHILQTIARAGGSADHAIMVGDSRTDERAAQHAGLPFIFVTFGYEATAAEQITAAAVIDTYSAFQSAITALVDAKR